ncbi:MAG: DeoR/GlpR family DNA-binding transcription regulator [Clostridiales bacterium]
MNNSRHEKILEILSSKESATVEELSLDLNVSVVTIRSDLNNLAKRGKIIRTHGGARLVEERIRQEYSFQMRKSINLYNKHKIGEAASKFICSEDSVLLDSSTTVLALAHAMRKKQELKDVTVIPTGIWTAIELMGHSDFNVLLPGGSLRHTTGSITGIAASSFFNELIIQKAFLGACGISIENGFTDTHLQEIELKKSIISRIKEITILLDGSKFRQTGLAAFAEINQVSRIITDATAPEEEVDKLMKLGVEVIIAR